jgi:ribose transport system substrate-binding protein
MKPTRLRSTVTCLAALCALAFVGCGEKKEAYDASGGNTTADDGKVTWDMVRDGAVTRTNPETGVTWTIQGIRTDEVDHARAKQNAEDALSAHPDLVGMVGLWAYNPPLMLQAVEGRDMLDQVKIVAFDEDKRTLDAIASGKMVGTIVQNPYEFGFRSVEYLSAKIRGQDLAVEEKELLYVPTRVITRDNIDGFAELTASILSGNGPTPEYDASAYDTSERVTLDFVTNVKDPFWDLAAEGCKVGAEKFNAEVFVFIPPEQGNEVAQQKTYVDQMIIQNKQGLAISVNDPANQVQMLNDWAEDLTLITVDSDAPNSDRLFYVGTDNTAAGRQAGELLAEAVPEGGKIMIFVGSLAQANAQERSQGVIDALFGQD